MLDSARLRPLMPSAAQSAIDLGSGAAFPGLVLAILNLPGVEQVEIDARYAGYLERQQRDIATFRRDEALLLPADLDDAKIGSLSREICESSPPSGRPL